MGNITVLGQMGGGEFPLIQLTSGWFGVLITILISILASVIGQLKASWDMRSDLRLGIAKIENLERTVNDHEIRLRGVEHGRPNK
jgi:hypothetical protein